MLDNILIICYLLVAGGSILVKNLYETGKFHNKFTNAIYEFLPFTLQFAFGGLFSAFTIFYSKSASFLSTGVFVLILFVLMIGNEFFKKRYQKLVFQIGIYFVAIFSFSIYFLPVVIKKMGAGVFLLSGATSVVIISVFIFLIARLAHVQYRDSKKFIFFTISGLWVFLNILYFTNIIPPIPLSLKDGDVYHLVERRSEGGYLVTGEIKKRWYQNLRLNDTIHLVPGEPVYVFSSVFAPTDLNMRVAHNWQYYDERDKNWVSASKIAFPIKGGRNEGYRGFSTKGNIFTGKWRVDIETERGQVMGRVRFDIEIVDFPPQLETRKI